MNHDKNQQPKSKLRMWLAVLAIFAVGIAVGLLFQGEGQLAAGGGLVFLLLLACPLMMIFMMRGGHGESKKDDERRR